MMSNKAKLFAFKGLGTVLFSLPLCVLAAIEREIFFVESQTKITLYGYIAVILFLLTLKEKVFPLVKKNPALTVSIFLLVTSLVMRRFSTELMYIGLCGIIGSVLAAFISPVEEVYYHLCYEDTTFGRKRIRVESVPVKEAFKRAYL